MEDIPTYCHICSQNLSTHDDGECDGVKESRRMAARIQMSRPMCGQCGRRDPTVRDRFIGSDYMGKRCDACAPVE